MLMGLVLRWLCRLDTLALSYAERAVVNAGAAVDLNDNARDQLLNAFHFPRLICFLVKLATATAAPLAKFPESWAWLTVAFHETFVDNWLFHVRAFFRRVGSRRLPTDTANDGLLRTASTRLRTWRESNHFPCELALFLPSRRRVGLRVGCLEFVVQREVVFARREVINF
jgi:hypothetical protein